jgi:hypothetical protein
MPVASDPAILAARARAIETARKRGGRESTILSDALQSMNGSAGQLGR